MALMDVFTHFSIIRRERRGIRPEEIKSFIGKSSISEFHTAIGQFFNYRVALEEKEPKRQLYLAVPLDIYYSFFELRFIQTVVKRFQIYLIIYDPIGEVIVEWKN